MRSEPILVTGATGYVGGRLIPALLDAGYRVRAMDRSFDKLACRLWAHHDQVELVQGYVLDFWRVLEVDPPHRLLLVAEMKTPGEALLECQITPVGNEHVELQLLSRFLPKGLSGIIYWYLLYPFHQWNFFGMLKSIAQKIGKPISSGPERFTPKLHNSCVLPSHRI